MLKIGDVAIVYATWAPLLLALLCLLGAWRGWRAKRALWRPPAALLALVALICLGASMGGMPVVLNNAQLKLLPSYQWSSVLRLGVNNLGDADPRWFVPSTTACAIVGGDIGSQNPSADGGCFNAIAISGPQDVREWAADPTGVADASVAINACLAASASCRADTGRFYAASQVKIPALGTLSCGEAKPMTSGAGWNTIAHTILYNSAVSPAIAATGRGVTIQNCAVLAHGLTFPLTVTTGFGTGIAISDQGNGDFTARNLAIVGDDNSILVTGGRPLLSNINHWGTGNLHGDIRWEVGNTDSGSADNIEGAVGYFSGGGWVCNPGTGFYVGGTPIGATAIFMHGKIVEEGYQTAQFDFENSVIADTLWADNSTADCGGYNPIGYKIQGNGTYVQVNQMTADQQKSPVYFNAAGMLSVSGLLYAGGGLGPMIELGPNAGTIVAGQIELLSSQANSPGIQWDTTNARVQSPWISLNNLNGGGATPPYLVNNATGNLTVGTGPSASLTTANLATDLGTKNPYSLVSGHSFVLGAGAHAGELLAPPTLASTCTGIGTGTSTIAGTPFDLSITMTPAGTPAAAGACSVNMPLPPLFAYNCTASVNGYWNLAATAQTGAALTVNWYNNSVALTAATNYMIHVRCGTF